MDAKTKLCAVIGKPIGHSLSPQLHNAAFNELGLNYAYVAFEVTNVTSAIAGVRALGIAGLSVTIPHKVASMYEMDEVDQVARDIGCINTVVNRQGRLCGYNTDGLGALNSLLEAGCVLDGKRVLFLGSGGAARAIAVTLAHKCSLKEITILGVLKDEREKLAKDVASRSSATVRADDLNADTLSNCVPNHEVLIQCTPVGMHPKTDETPAPSSLLTLGSWVFDVVYNPLETRFLREAKEKGCHAIPGVEMFVRQAAAQFSLWTEMPAPVQTMRNVVLSALGGKS